MANPFDQFDAPATSNPFDAFDDPSFKPPKPSGMLRRGIGDTAVSLGKGVIGLGEGAVGLSSLATGGLAGQLAEQAGFRPKEAKAMLDEFYSPEQQAANRAVSDAKGFGGTLSSILQNPSVVPQMVAESLPSMIGGQAIAKGALKAAGLAGEAITPTAARWAGAGGEGAITAGGVAEQIRQEAPDGNIYAAVPAGVATGLIGVAGGKLANRMGLGDVDTALLTAANRGTASLPKRILGGVASEGLLEEMPQSMQEQFFQNLGTGKPLGEGVAEAGASGLVTGGAMGGAFGILHKPAGPLSRAADTSIQSGAAQEQQRVAAEHAAQAIGQPPSSAQAVSRGDSAPSTEESPVRTTSSDADQQNSSSSPLGFPQYNGPTQYVHPDGSVSTDPQAIRSAIEAERMASLAPQPYDAPLEEAKATRREQMARAQERAKPMPTTNVAAAQKKADELTQETGVPHGVVATGKKASGKPLVVVQAQAEAVLQDSTNAGGADGKDNLEKSVATQGSQSSQVPVLGVGNRGLDATQSQGARPAGVEVGRALSGNDGVAEDGQTATSVGTVAQGANVQDAPNVSDKTPDQLAYLATNGKPGWKEAAQAEIQRRSLSSKGSPIVNQVVKDSSTTQTGQISGQETAKTSASAGVSADISADKTHSEIDAKIADAEKSGIRLSENDKSAIRKLQSEADDLNRRANRTSALGSDPMGKGNAFPMGVGFTKMTKRKSQAIDSSVRRAGEAVELYKRAQTKQGQIERMLSGKDTEAYHEEELAKTERFQRAIVDKLLNWKRGDKIGKNVIERVSLDKDGYPSSFTVSGDGIIKGIWDKTDIARDYFDGDKEKLRRMVDDVRQSTKLQAVTDQPQPATNQPPADTAQPEPTPGQAPAAAQGAAQGVIRDHHAYADAPPELRKRIDGNKVAILVRGSNVQGAEYVLYEDGTRTHYTKDWKAVQGEASGKDAVGIAMRYRVDNDIVAVSRAAADAEAAYQARRNGGVDAPQAQGARPAGVEAQPVLRGIPGETAAQRPDAGQDATAQGASVPNAAQAPDVAGKTPDQLAYLATNGKPGWKEAAQAEIARRSQADTVPQSGGYPTGDATQQTQAEQTRSDIDSETMETRANVPHVAQPTPTKTVTVATRTLNGPKNKRAKLYELPGYNGPQLAVVEYGSGRGQGYRVYLPKTGAMVADNNGVMDLNETLKLAVLRVQNARNTITKRESANQKGQPNSREGINPVSEQSGNVSGGLTANATTPATNQGVQNGQEKGRRQEVLNEGATAPSVQQTQPDPTPGQAQAGEKDAAEEIFIRKATKRERTGGKPNQDAMRALPEKDGYEVVFKPYGNDGEGFYYKKRNADRKASGESLKGAAQGVVRDQPTHSDPGQSPKTATAPVISKSLQKSSRNTPLNIKEAKAWLLSDIDRAIANVPPENNDMAVELAQDKTRKFKLSDRVAKLGKGVMRHKLEKSEREQFDATQSDRIAKIARQIGFVTFDVPGDGKFRVVNTVDAIAAFRAKVEASPGFREQRSRSVPAQRSTASQGELSRMAKEPLDDKSATLEDLANAIEIARANGIDDIQGVLDRFEEVASMDYDTWRGEQDANDLRQGEPSPSAAPQSPEQSKAADLSQAEQPKPAPAKASEPAVEVSNAGGAKSDDISKPETPKNDAGSGAANADRAANTQDSKTNGEKPLPALSEIARRLGIAVETSRTGFHASSDGKMVVVPQEDRDAKSAVSANHILAHELGHAIIARRGLNFRGIPGAKIAENWRELLAASKEFRPGVWNHARDDIRAHAKKPNEILADAIASVLMGEKPVSMLKPFMEKTGTTLRDLGLQTIEEANAEYRQRKASEPIGAQGKESAVSLTNDATNVKESAKSATRLGNKGSFLDPSLPVNTGVNARMVVIDKDGTKFKRTPSVEPIATQAFKQGVQSMRTAFPGVRIIPHNSDSAPSIPAGLRAEIAKAKAANGEGVAGAFHEGAVHVFRSGIMDAAHLEKTVVHELTHRGLARMFGLGINKPLNEIYASNPKVAAAADQLAKRYGYAKPIATEEVLADLGAEMVGVKGFDKLVAYVRAALRKLGLVSEWSDNDVALLVQRAREKNRGGVTGSTKFAPAWHGSPHDFDRFSLDKIGTGEGAQAYGHGLYFAGRKEVADYYRKTLSEGRVLLNGEPADGATDRGAAARLIADGLAGGKTFDVAREDIAKQYAKYRDAAAKDADGLAKRVGEPPAPGWGTLTITDEDVQQQRDRAKYYADKLAALNTLKEGEVSVEKGRLYSVELAPAEDEYLLWDKPLSEQSEKVKAALSKEAASYRAMKRERDARIEAVGFEEASKDKTNESKYGVLGTAAKGWMKYLPSDIDGMDLYKTMQGAVGDKAASDYLHSIGIRGIKYLDGSSRSHGDGNYNYVIFNDADVSITAKYSRSAQAFARATDSAAFQKSGEILSDLFTTHGTFGALKGLKTQYHKATLNPMFKAFWERANAMAMDSARSMSRPADLASRILPKFDPRNMGDAAKALFAGRSDVLPGDLKAVSRALSDGTLDGGPSPLKGKVWTDEELSKRGMNDKQASLYREARAAIDSSLTEVAAATAWSLARRSIENDFLRQRVAEAPEEASVILPMAMDYAIAREVEKLREAQDGMAEAYDPEAAAKEMESIQKHLSAMQDDASSIRAIFDKAEALKQAGYMPLMRFGKYRIAVTMRENGKEVATYVGRYESHVEANRARRELERQFSGSEFTVGPVSIENENAWKMFKGVNPETVMLFAEEAGIKADDVMQEWYREAVSNRSALRRMVHRTGVKGYSEDLPRVLASFITSNGKQAGYAYHLGDMQEMLQNKDMPGDVQEEAQSLLETIQEPTEAGSKMRGLMAMWYLLGSIGSALVNSTQTVTMSIPWLSQFGAKGFSATEAASAMGKAYKIVVNPITMPADLKAAMKRAEQNGTVDSNEVFHLYAESMKPMISKLGSGNRAYRARAFMTLWGAPFAMVETLNRRATFAAAYSMAKAQGKSEGDAAKFAERAVIETQGIYAKHNRPNWSRGAIGAATLTFKQFSIAYVEMLSRMAKNGPEGKKAALLTLGILMALSGASGLPGEDDLLDVIDTFSQIFFDKPTLSRMEIRNFLHDNLGKELGGFVNSGVSNFLPVDVSSRLGLGNLIPGTGLFKPSEKNKTGELLEIFAGVQGGFVRSMVDSVRMIAEGNVSGAIKSAAPKAIQDVAKGVEMLATGEARDRAGRKVVDASPADSIWQMIGLNPNVKAEAGKKAWDVTEYMGYVKRAESNIVGRWARGIADGDMEAIHEAQQALTEWNLRNPDSPIGVSHAQIMQRVQALRSERSGRIEKTAPMEMRARARELMGED